MPEYLAPGLFIEEIDSGSKPIEGVGTNTAAFIGYAKSGDFNTPKFITNWSQFCNEFGEEENAITEALCRFMGMSVAAVRNKKAESRKGWMEYLQAVHSEAVRSKKTETKDFNTFIENLNVPVKNSPYIKNSYLAHAVRGFYDNGGGRAYIVRIPRPEDVTAIKAKYTNGAASDAGHPAVAASKTYGALTFTSKLIGAAGNGTKVDVVHTDRENKPLKENEFRIIIKQGDQTDELPDRGAFTTLEQAVERVNTKSTLVQMEVQAGVDVKTAPRPEIFSSLLEAGTNAAPNIGRAAQAGAAATSGPSLSRELMDLTPDVWDGDEDNGLGLGSMYAVEDVDMICFPDLMNGLYSRDEYKVEVDGGRRTETRFTEEQCLLDSLDGRRAAILGVQKALVDYCERAGNRMCILDPIPELKPQEMDDLIYKEVKNFGCSKGQAAIYYPWVKINDPVNKGQQILVPPCGHVAGVYARAALERGVHKAPANEVLMGVVDLAREVTKGEQEKLNPDGINCIRSFPGQGIRIWGARTLATVSNPSWKYVNVRRLFNYLEKSMERNLQWVVFEPNDEDLWGRVRRTISAFLYTEWREGKLFGTTPGQAFYVKCDAETNPQEMIDLGRMYCEVGINPVKPAEFVIIRMGQWSGGGSMNEQ